MLNQEIEEFARALVRQVRDAAIRNCDVIRQPEANAPVALRWRALNASASDVGVIVSDIVDETVLSLIHAIDAGTLRLKFVSSSGREIDLTEEGQSELAGWYMGSGCWRAMFSEERYVDDFADLAGDP